MPFQIIRNDITKVKADAIVNTANPFPIVGDGTDTAIYKAAGWDALLAERQKIGLIEPGNTEYTAAFNLNAKYIFHTVGPAWIDGKHDEKKILRASYRSALELADQLSCRSIAFPLLASGSYRFPKDVALQIALEEIQKFLLEHEMRILLVVFDRKAFELSSKLVGKIDEYIDEHSVGELHIMEYGELYDSDYHASGRIRGMGRPPKQGTRDARLSSRRLTREEELALSRRLNRRVARDIERRGSGKAAMLGADKKEESWQSRALSFDGDFWKPEKKTKTLDDILDEPSETFQQKLFHLIDDSGLSDTQVYKRANISKQLFSKIRSDVDYSPKKKTVFAFAIALKLDIDATQDLLARAGYAMSPSSKFDLIISYFITHHDYDIFKINSTLFGYGQPTLGV